MNYPRLIVISLLMLTAYSNASAQAKPLKKRTYAAPSDFLSYGSGSIVEASEDPFADAVSAEPATAQDILWAAGVKFPRGASANFDQETSLLTVVNTQENHVIVELALEGTFSGLRFASISKNLRLLVECITLPHDEAITFVHQHMSAGDATPLRRELQKRIKSGHAEITASAMVTTRSGQRAKSQSIAEEIYPAEYDPGDFPQIVTGKLNGNPNFLVGVRGTAFETRNAGITLEVDPVLGSDSWTVDLNLSYNNVELIGSTTYGSGLSQLSQPVFYSQRISTALSTGNGTCSLVAVTTPTSLDVNRPSYDNNMRTLVFVRSAVIKPQNRPEIENPSVIRQVSILLEAIEMDSNAAAEMMQMRSEFLNDAPMRDRALQLIADGMADRRETSYLVTRSGQRARIDSVKEIIYPSETDPPEVPIEARIDSDTAKMVVPITPTAFNTRNVGITIELEPILWSETAIDVKIAPELSELIGWDSYGKKEAKLEQPVFHTVKTSTSTRLIDSQPVLLSAHVPIDRVTRKPKADRRIVIFLTGAVQKVNP